MSMRRSNRLAVPAVFLLSVLTLSALQEEAEIVLLDEVVARVNDEIITLVELQRELRVLHGSLSQELESAEELEEAYDQQRRGLLKTMIQNKMLVQRAAEYGMTEGMEQRVSETLESMREKSGIPNMEVLDEYLRKQGSSLTDYRETLKQRLIIDTLLQQFVYSRITLLTAEIEEYYNQHEERYTEPAELELREILFLSEDTPPQLVRRKAEEVLAELSSGASFEDLARRYSEGPTAAQGGDIGTFKLGSMAEVIEQAALSLEVGEVSGIIETDYGLLIIQVVSKREAQKQPLEAVRAEISRQLYQQKARPGMKAFMDEVREDSYIHVSPQYSQEYDVEGLTSN